MKYFFVLGNHPALSVAELAAVFPEAGRGELISREIFAFETEEKIAKEAIKKLGGAIKFGLIQSEARINTEDMLKKITPELLSGQGKYHFGFSYYGKQKINLKPLGMEIKKYLKENGVSCRWVVSREKTLSSVVVEQNKLLANGQEIVLIEKGSKVLIGFTEAVQPFKELSFRDYGRPARDDQSGMLPPKLAQIMINLASTPSRTPDISSQRLLDPFCGSGTIITEAMLMGFKDLVGSDISEKAIRDTEENIAWIKNEFQISDFKIQLRHQSATEISQIIKPNSIDIIATEPYLGPQRGHLDMRVIVRELNELYTQTIKELAKIIKPEGRIVMLFPVFRVAGRHYMLSPQLDKFKIINPLPAHLQNIKTLQTTEHQTIIYGREDQRVWREIVILEK